MRFIHTADWHLGRLFHGRHLTDDQAYVLDQFLDFAKDAKPDCIIVAGDIYDRAIPPPEAVELLDEVLSKLVLDLEIPTILIAGNHDSPGRLGFGSRVLGRVGLHVTGEWRPTNEPVSISDKFGDVKIYPVPYCEPSHVREVLGDESSCDHHTSMAAMMNSLKAARAAKERSVVVAHAFVSGGSESESERPLSVGGVSMVDASVFDGFHYTALGHLHQPQKIGRGEVRYSGSLLKYSFSEADHKKCVHLVEMDGEGNCIVEDVPFTPKHEVRRISGMLKELLKAGENDAAREDYLEVTLDDPGLIMEPMARLRDVYPNVMNLLRSKSPTNQSPLILNRQRRGLDDMQLFHDFFEQMTGDRGTEEQAEYYRETVERIRQAERVQ